MIHGYFSRDRVRENKHTYLRRLFAKWKRRWHWQIVLKHGILGSCFRKFISNKYFRLKNWYKKLDQILYSDDRNVCVEFLEKIHNGGNYLETKRDNTSSRIWEFKNIWGVFVIFKTTWRNNLNISTRCVI